MGLFWIRRWCKVGKRIGQYLVLLLFGGYITTRPTVLNKDLLAALCCPGAEAFCPLPVARCQGGPLPGIMARAGILYLVPKIVPTELELGRLSLRKLSECSPLSKNLGTGPTQPRSPLFENQARGPLNRNYKVQASMIENHAKVENVNGRSWILMRAIKGVIKEGKKVWQKTLKKYNKRISRGHSKRKPQ